MDVAYGPLPRRRSRRRRSRAADRFIKLYPNSPATPYAYYLKGLVNFNLSLGLLERYLPTDPSQRDAGAALEAYKDFEELVRRFPRQRVREGRTAAHALPCATTWPATRCTSPVTT